MLNVEIRRPTIENHEELNEFFRVVITDTFAKEGLSELLDDIEKEIEVKREYIKNDFESNGENRYFLIAVAEGEIIGSIEYGPVSQLINSCTGEDYKELIEVGTVFVHPSHQRQGVGNLLLNSMVQILQIRGIEEFYLDSGYSNAQRIWLKKFGEPDYLLKDYWSEGNDHMIWRVRVNVS